MKRFLCLVSTIALLSTSVLLRADDEKTPSIKTVMQKLHKGAKSPLAKLKTGLKQDSPDWKNLQNLTKDFVILGASLAKSDPPKGEAKAYKKLADAYFENSKALDDAAKGRDKPKAEAAFKKVSTSCAACHKAHKGS
jgi:hypothetical protein